MCCTWLHRIPGPSSLCWWCTRAGTHRSSAGLCHTHTGSYPCFMMEIQEVRGVNDKVWASKYVPPTSLKIPPYWWDICCLLEDCDGPSPSSQEVLTFGTLGIKQQVRGGTKQSHQLSPELSLSLYHSQLSTKHIKHSQRDLKNNDTICLITCIVNWLFWQ